jgi:hypothetical protein
LEHLQLRIFAQSNRLLFSVDNLFGTVNGDTGANYAQHGVAASSATTTAPTASNGVSQTALTVGGINSGVATSVFTGTVVDYLDYANTNKAKTMRHLGGYNNNSSGYIVCR